MLSSIYCCTSHKICCSRILRYQKHSTAQRNQLAQSRVRQRKQADREHLLIVRCVCCIVAVPEVQHSAAQSAGTKPLRKQVFTYVRADQSGTTQPSRLGESQYAVVEIQYEFSERRNRNLPGRHKYTIAHKALAGWCDARRFSLDLNKIQHCSFSPSLTMHFVRYGTCMRRPGYYPGARSSWHLQVVSLHLKSWTFLSASFAFCSILLFVRAYCKGRERKRQVQQFIRGTRSISSNSIVREE